MAINVNTDINYEDDRFKDVKADEKAELTENEKLYGGMIKDSDKYYQAQIDATNQWEATQKKNQQAQTDFAINKIEQQKDQAKKDYTKEQSGAYVDWQKQSNAYGANAEQRASMGMAGTGYSESAQVSMYNTYQNRVATARESYNRAVLDYDNAIQEARLQNNSLLAEIAYNALQKRLELSLAGFQYKNTLITEKANQRRQIKETYRKAWQDVLAQINKEIDRDIDIASKNETIRLQEESQKLEREKFNWQKEQAEKTSGGSGDKIIKTNNIQGQIKGGKPSATKTEINKDDTDKSTKKQKLSAQASSKNFTNPNQVEAYLDSIGVPMGKGLRLLTSSEWNIGKRNGEQGSELEYNSYSSYLKHYVLWCISNS